MGRTEPKIRPSPRPHCPGIGSKPTRPTPLVYTEFSFLLGDLLTFGLLALDNIGHYFWHWCWHSTLHTLDRFLYKIGGCRFSVKLKNSNRTKLLVGNLFEVAELDGIYRMAYRRMNLSFSPTEAYPLPIWRNDKRLDFSWDVWHSHTKFADNSKCSLYSTHSISLRNEFVLNEFVLYIVVLLNSPPTGCLVEILKYVCMYNSRIFSPPSVSNDWCRLQFIPQFSFWSGLHSSPGEGEISKLSALLR